MDRLHLMTVFVAVAEEESFNGGARRLAMSPPAVTRCVAALEARLGVKLLDRTTRYVRVTEAGQRYLDDARRIIAEVDEADEAVVGINGTPKGQLTVTAPVLFGKLFVTPVLVEYLQRYPQMDVNALFLDRVVNLMEEGVDVGVRIGELPDSSMKALRVGEVRRVLVGATGYLAEHGVPGEPGDLAGHRIVAATGVTPSVEWKFAQGRSVRLRPRLTVTSNEAAIEAVRAGFGVTRLMSYQVASLVAAGELQVLMEDFEVPPLPIHVLHREGRHKSARVRTLVDLMVERLRGAVNSRI
ncbi:DNA-binding transcriptional LysR family regulator [Fluviicoccus keumensis]|uniref:DNA-binding transcriptional LysR family regulator n=1 Tax=Fluviicoccus keumensis TaxID=1435465 RepID=A0A4Q7ZDG9_9GAMM|nr:LysR family transcriptional regulator [Fluviicoccus keumensis]RZU48075.1 DNA-binding transcriptional LysR family regulator [Fluviicoccus keumensis]